MTFPKLSAFAFALMAAWSGPAPAATLDYALTIPLIDIGATDPNATSLLSGTLSYDDEAMSGSGLFTLGDATGSVTDTYAGFAWLLPLLDSTTGILFDGFTEAGAELYFNIVASSAANTIRSGPVNACSFGCSMFQSVGATLTLAVPQTTLPGEISLPGAVVSPVPLPPAMSLFGAALLGLAGLGMGRRLAPRWGLSSPRPVPCGTARKGR